MKNFIFKYEQFVNEAKSSRGKFFPRLGNYVESDYTPRWKDTPQRYRNLADHQALGVLRFIWEAGEKGRKMDEIKRFYFGRGDVKGKRYRIDYGDWSPETGTSIDFEGEREYDPTKDRGMGSTLFYGSDYWGKQTGILNAHCDKNAQGNWVLTDKKLKKYFDAVKMSDLLDPEEFDALDQLGMFD